MTNPYEKVRVRLKTLLADALIDECISNLASAEPAIERAGDVRQRLKKQLDDVTREIERVRSVDADRTATVPDSVAGSLAKLREKEGCIADRLEWCELLVDYRQHVTAAETAVSEWTKVKPNASSIKKAESSLARLKKKEHHFASRQLSLSARTAADVPVFGKRFDELKGKYDKATGNLRSELNEVKAEAVSSFSQNVLECLTKNWQITSAVVTAVFQVIGAAHAYIFYRHFGVQILAHAELSDFLAVGFKRGWPAIGIVGITVLVLLGTLRRGARVSKDTSSTVLKSAYLASSRSALVMIVVFGLSVSVLGSARFSIYIAKQNGETSVHTKVFGSKTGRVLGGTSKYLFLQSPAGEDKTKVYTVLRSDINYIGPESIESIQPTTWSDDPAFLSSLRAINYLASFRGNDRGIHDWESFTRTFLQCDPHPTLPLPSAVVKFNHNDFTTKDREELLKLKTLKEEGFPEGTTVNVVGFASEVGDPDYNLWLSEKRAGFVKTKIGRKNAVTFALGETIHPFDDQGKPNDPPAVREARRLKAVVIVCSPDVDLNTIAAMNP